MSDNLIAGMELPQQFKAIVVNAVGVASKFDSFVKSSNNKELIEKYKAFSSFKGKKIPKELFLSKADQLRAKNLLEKEGEVTKEPSLDPWQSTAIKAILDRKSIAVFGPTSGGKTYVVKYAINELKSSGIKRAIFVAPTFHLALQIYSDIQVTYTGFPASIFTDKLIEYNKESWIWVGTAETLLNVLLERNETYDVGIFDEIHSISTNVYTDKDRTSATHSLLQLCKSQIIALSASIRKDDVGSVVKYLEDRTGLRGIQPIIYEKRAVPQDVLCLKQSYDMKNIFLTMRHMKEEKMLPALFFYFENAEEQFEKFTSFLEDEEEREYKKFHEYEEYANEKIDTFNAQVSEYRQKLFEKGNPDMIKYITDFEETLRQNRNALLKALMEKLKDFIYKIVEDPTYDSEYSEYISEGWAKGFPLKEPHDGSPELEELVKIYKYYSDELWVETISPVQLVPNYRGSFFRFGSSEFYNFTKKRGEQRRKGLNVMKQMASAEGIPDDKIEPFIEIVSRGFEFGITSLTKELPFFIQYQIMEMLKEKNLGVVFTNESMSMGINYPLRSVCIISEKKAEYPISILLQMAGRCGRRGFDTTSTVVYWGIENYRKVKAEHIEPFIPPTEDYVMDETKLEVKYIRNYKDMTKSERKELLEEYRKKCIEEYRNRYKF